ncbi:unnamed protein product, partial [marine sediment metagenome]
IPQFHLDYICDELKGGQEGRFNEELKQVIFSRIPTEERLGKASLDELVEFRTAESQASIRQILENLRKGTVEVVKLEEQSTDTYISGLKSDLEEVKKEINSHKSIKPEEIKKPEADPKKKKETEEISKKIEELATHIANIDKIISQKHEELNRIVFRLRLAEKIYKKIETFKLQTETVLEEISPECKKLGISANDLIRIEIDLSKLDETEEKLRIKKDSLDVQLKEEDKEKSLVLKRKKMKNEINIFRDRLDRPNKEYQRYLAVKAKWEEKLKFLIGKADIPNSLEYYKTRLAEIEKIPEKLSNARDKQSECVQRIFQVKKSLLKVYEELYAPVQEFIDNHPLAQEKFGLEFRVSLVPRNFSEKFLEYINQQRRGSFHGEAEGRQTISHLVASSNLNEDVGITEFIDKVVD